MKHHSLLFRKAALALALAVSVSSAMAVEVADVTEPKFDELPSPELPGTKNKDFKPKDWLEVEAGITIPAQNKENEEVGFFDSVVVKWYVAIKDKASKQTMLLTTEITHINVPVGEEFYSSVYLSPNTAKRLTGRDKGSKSDVEVVALEVLLNGVKVGEATSKFKTGWWTSSKLGRGDRFPLLNKNQTPFRNFWWDRYAEIEERR
ncbi:MAG: hypothetical protein MUF31_06160 [Akkermansiaceae bacterium]|jgi:hypothetical protein|nr:hypothetical protein [Akkermansiaceae bacterium]